jgi:cytochrome c peroxidase
MRKLLGGSLLTVSVMGCTTDLGGNTNIDAVAKHGGSSSLHQMQKFRNPTGYAATYTTDPSGRVDLTGDFFTSLGTNGRTCGSCHLPDQGWTIIPSKVQDVFDHTNGLDPVFRLNDGANSPNADISTTQKRRQAFSMLLSKALIRVGIGIPAGAEFTLDAVDDPYGYASSTELSLFRRPLPSANLQFLSTVMWDGRETQVDAASPPALDSNCYQAPFPAKCFKSIETDLLQQSLDATLGHAQAMVPGLTADQQHEIVDFEMSLNFAQVKDDHAGKLDRHGANGGPEAIPGFPAYFGINDNFGDYRTHQPFTTDVFSLYDAWAGSDPGSWNDDDDGDYNAYSRVARRRAVARGQAIFNAKTFTISGVAGLNGSLGLPASFQGTCTTCHDAPEAGDHSVVAPLNIGLTDASRRTPDMPLYRLKCSSAGAEAHHCTAGQTVLTTDPGRALLTGLWADVGKFKGPILRGLASRAPYFHNGLAKDLGAAVDFYDDRFGIGFSAQERADLVAFLQTL